MRVWASFEFFICVVVSFFEFRLGLGFRVQDLGFRVRI